MRISELADRAGVNIETVRYYERRGLVPEPPRTPSGYRAFKPETVDRIRFIKRAQVLGFTLAEIAELLSLRVRPAGNCEEVRKVAEVRRHEIEERIQALGEMKRSLDRLIAACRASQVTSECPILEGLET